MDVTRMPLPKSAKNNPALLKPPLYSFAKHYVLHRTHCQRMDTKHKGPRIPLLEGFTMPTQSKDPETNALYKSVLFRPMYCSGGTSKIAQCNKIQPFEHLCDEKGWSNPWKTWFHKQKKRAIKAEQFCKNLQMTPSFHLFRTAACDQFTMKPRLIRWFFAYITYKVTTNMDLVAEARTRANNPKIHDATEIFDDPSIAKNILIDPHTTNNATDGLERDDDQCGSLYHAIPTQPLYPITSQDCDKISRFELVKPTRDGKKIQAAYQTLYEEHPHECPNTPLDNTFEGGKRWFSDFDNNLAMQEAKTTETEQLWQHNRQKQLNCNLDNDIPPHIPANIQNNLSPLLTAKWSPNQISHMALTLAKNANCNEDQIDIAAVATAALCRTYTNNEQSTQRFLIIHGAGGAGKTHVINNVVRPLARKMFGPAGERAVALPNSVARILGDGATTIHAAFHATHRQNLDTRSLSATKNKDALTQEWEHVKLLIIDEMSMVPPLLLNSLSFCISLARKNTHNLNMSTYPTNFFGKMPITILLGDFLQLPPVLSKSLTDHPSGYQGATSADMYNGWETYKTATDCIMLHANKRCHDPKLDSLLNIIRQPNPQDRQIPDSLWRDFQTTWIGATKHLDNEQQDTRLKNPLFLNGTFLAIQWQIVARQQITRTLREAKQCGQILHYVAACDRTNSTLTKQEYHHLLQTPNMTKLGRMMGIFPFHINARVRLTQRISRAHGLVQDAPGTVVGVDYNPSENTDWLKNKTSDTWKSGVVALRFLPLAIHVAFDDHIPRENDNFPGTDFNNGHAPGIFAVKPMTVTTNPIDIPTPENTKRRKLKFSRTQIPLTPHNIRTSNGCQGISTEYVIIDCAQPPWLRGNESTETTYWLHLYVMLSRARSMEQMLLINPPPRFLLQTGPPQSVLQELQRLQTFAESTKNQIAKDREFLNWPSRTDDAT